jgi:hypothetical protein
MAAGRPLLAVLAVAWAFGTPAEGAPVADLFTLTGVVVDVTAKSAAAARKQAMALGERRAFDRLLQRLTLRADKNRLPRLEAAEIKDFVQDFAVADEKVSPVRYLARLTFRFNAREIRQLLRDFDLPFAETRSKPVLLLPVFQSAGVVALWDEPNPWRKAWDRARMPGGMVPLKLPLGDLADIGSIGAEQAAAGDKVRLLAVARRYEVADSIVALAILGADGRGVPALEFVVTRYNEGRADQSFRMTAVAQPGEALDALLGRAAREVAAGIEDQWKRDNLLRFGKATVLAVTLPIRSLRDWVEAKKRLQRLAVITRLDLVLISRDEVRVNLHHIGEIEQLSLALAQSDMVLFQNEEGWILNFNSRAMGGRGERRLRPRQGEQGREQEGERA